MDALKTVDDLLNLSPLKFQEMTMSLYKALGCQVWPRRITGWPHLYVDIVTKDNKKSLAECRISLEDVDKEAVENFATLLKKEKAIDGAMITMVGVTDRARQTARKKRIYLYSGSDFLSLWNNLHISDTTPRGTQPGETPAFQPESILDTLAPETVQEMVIPTSMAEVIPQTPPEEAHESFLDQLQAETENDQKPNRSREEIHRLFETTPSDSLPLDAVPPSKAESTQESTMSMAEGENDLRIPEPLSGDQLSFFDQAASEPEPDVIPTSADFLASLEGLAQPPQETAEPAEPFVEPPAGFEPLPIEAAAPLEETLLPPAESIASEPELIAEMESPVNAAEFPPEGSEAPTTEPPVVMPADAPILPKAHEPENVIERLFGRGIEAFEPTGRLQSAEAEEKIDFSIFQVPGAKQEPTEDAVLPSDETPLSAGEVESVPAEPGAPVTMTAATVELPEGAVEPVLEPPHEEATPTQPVPISENLIALPADIPLVETQPLAESEIVDAANEMEPPTTEEPPVSLPDNAPAEGHEEAVAIPDFLLPLEFTHTDGLEDQAEAVKAAWEPLEPSQEIPAEAPADAPAETPDVGATLVVAQSTEVVAQTIETVPPQTDEVVIPETPEEIVETPPVETPAAEKVTEPPQGPSIVVLNPAEMQTARSGPDPDNLSFCQALERLEGDSPCLFLTGRPGTGKSLLLDHFRESSNKNVVLLEPTALEAAEAEAQTIRSFFGFQEGELAESDVHEAEPAQKVLYQHVDTLILDNVARVSPNLVDAVDVFMRLNGRDSAKPFGGTQLLLLGDLFLASGPVHGVTDLRGKEYRSPFFFDAHVFETLAMELIELKKDYDPRDEALTALLNAIRTNALDEAQYKLLNDRYIPDFTAPEEPAYVTLTSNSSVATKINKEHLRQLRSPECLHLAEIEGQFDEASYPAARELILRKGAQVIFLKEDYARKWVKGTVGKVATISESTIQVEINSDGFPFVFRVERETWQNFRYSFNPASGKIEKSMVGEFTQYPLVPGWAMTTLKAQGARFDRVVIDLSGEEADAGQLYAALCCCRKLDGIVLKDRISPKYKANTGNRIQEIASLFTD